MQTSSNQSRLTDEQWSAIMADYESSNLSQKKFCHEREINFILFKNARCRLSYKKNKNKPIANAHVFEELRVTSSAPNKLTLKHINGVECTLPATLGESEILAIIRGLLTC